MTSTGSDTNQLFGKPARQLIHPETIVLLKAVNLKKMDDEGRQVGSRLWTLRFPGREREASIGKSLSDL